MAFWEFGLYRSLAWPNATSNLEDSLKAFCMENMEVCLKKLDNWKTTTSSSGHVGAQDKRGAAISGEVCNVVAPSQPHSTVG